MRFCFLALLPVFAFLSARTQVVATKTVSGILVTEKGDSVLFYQMERKSLEGKYERCNYIHPLWAADGTVLTEDFPADHLHHRGIFWAWHQLYADGKSLGDGWELKDLSQNIKDCRIEEAENGTLKLTAKVEWKSPDYESGEKPFLLENTEIKIHPAEKNYRRIDFVISLKALVKNFEIGGSADEKGYSGFSVRMKLPEDVAFSGSGGNVVPQNTAVESPGFVNISGSILKNKGKGGIVMIDNPENSGYPQKCILRAKNSMQNVAFPGRIRIAISERNPLILKYSLIVYSGETDAGMLNPE